jgi:hypothetical protein
MQSGSSEEGMRAEEIDEDRDGNGDDGEEGQREEDDKEPVAFYVRGRVLFFSD